MHVGLSLLTLLPGAAGGAETYVRGLLDAFGRADGEVRLTVLANDRVQEAYAPRARGAWHLQPMPYRQPGSDAGRFAAMARAAARPPERWPLPPDLSVMHHPVTVPLPRTRLPQVVSLLDVQHRELPELFSRAERAFRAIAYDRAAQRADVVITISHHAKGQIAERLGVPPERIHVSHLAVDRERFAPEGDDAPLEGLDLPERFVVYPANLWPHKNHDRLLQALARVDPGVHLVLTGATYGRLDALLARARELGVAERVRHLGYVDHDAVPALYRRARALVFPSLFEGFGLPPLEAMSCGCPVASSDRGSLAEVCAGAALTFDPLDPEAIADAIGRATGDEATRERLVRAGAERARAFTWDAAREVHVAAYRAATLGPP